MVERQNDQWANPQIEWPRGIESDQLQSLLDENRQGAKLRSVVSRALRSESDSLSSTLGSRSHPSVDGFINVASDLNNSVEFVDNGKDIKVERITNELFAQTDSSVLDKLGLLAGKLDQYRQLVPGIEIIEASELPRYLAEIMQRVAILKSDPRGFALVDYLAEPEQNAYPRGHSNFEPENLGRKEAAQRYKELYNLLLANGATSD